MTATKTNQILADIKATTIRKGDGVYLVDGDRLVVDRCQPAYSLCLVYGEWDSPEDEFEVGDMDWLDWGEIKGGIEQAVEDNA